MYKKGWLTPFAVVLLFIGILFTYQESYMDNILATSTTKSQHPWDKNASDIQKISYSWQNEKIIAERINNNWQLIQPIQTPADSTYIYNIISTFINPGVRKTIATEDINFDLYGITDSSPTLTLYDQHNVGYELVCGKAFDSIHYYTYSPLTNSIYTVPKTMFDSISTTLSSWYDKNYIYFTPEVTERIEIIYQSNVHTITPVKKEDTLNFSSSTLDANAVNYIINFLKTSKIDQFITNATSDSLLKTYGFDGDPLTLKLYQTNKEYLELQINIKSPTDTGYYVYLPQTSTLITIPLFNIESQPVPKE